MSRLDAGSGSTCSMDAALGVATPAHFANLGVDSRLEGGVDELVGAVRGAGRCWGRRSFPTQATAPTRGMMYRKSGDPGGSASAKTSEGPWATSGLPSANLVPLGLGVVSPRWTRASAAIPGPSLTCSRSAELRQYTHPTAKPHERPG